MQFCRLYTGADGKSHFEDLNQNKGSDYFLGTIKTFHPGDVFLAEDVTGQGHTARPKNWVRLFIHL